MLETSEFIKTTGFPKKCSFSQFFFADLERGVLGVKNNSKNFGNKKIVGSLAKF